MGYIKEFRCMNGHSRDVFEHSRDDLYCTSHSGLVFCQECGHTMGPVMSLGHPMLYFEEGRTRMINHLDLDAIPISSYKQYEEAKQRRGVENYGARKGGKGSWV